MIELTVEDVRQQTEQWILENWHPEMPVRDWWGSLAAAGFSSPTLPVEAGGLGWPRDLASALMACLAREQIMGPPGGLGLLLAAPTIAAFGTPEQVARYVPRILDGSEGWCQLFSEPQPPATG